LLRSTRRRFLARSATTAAGALLWPGLNTLVAANSGPSLKFPSQPRERIAIASYPFREVIAGGSEQSGHPSNPKIELQDFAAHVVSKFNINKIEPWSAHFRSLDGKYLDQLRAAVTTARVAIVNIAVDGEHSPYAADRAEREKAIQFSKQWVDVAAAIGSPSIRTNIPPATDSQPDLQRAADSLLRVAEYAATKNVVINLENDNAVSEDPFFLVKLIERINTPWLHALPDFANTLVTGNEEHAYNGIHAMFGHAYNICHVKAMEVGEKGKLFRVDMARTFAMLKSSGYQGYCSMEWDSPGDPYQGTSELIEMTTQYLSQ
jgi:sugar phosphate isomerase/epimerase